MEAEVNSPPPSPLTPKPHSELWILRHTLAQAILSPRDLSPKGKIASLVFPFCAHIPTFAEFAVMGKKKVRGE